MEDEESPWSGLLHVLALAAAMLLGAALLLERSHVIDQKSYLAWFTIFDFLGVLLLPVMMGMFCRRGAHSILAMVALSAAVQVILFRLIGAAPDWVFLSLAAVTLPGVPLGLALIPDGIDPRRQTRGIETTTGRLLRSKRRRGNQHGGWAGPRIGSRGTIA